MTSPRTGPSGWVIHPGVILREEFLEPMGISANRLAHELHVSAPTINDIVLERRAITPKTAVLLARYFGTTQQFWVNLQSAYDLKLAAKQLAGKLQRIKPLAR
jgi:antitoxin HigA-1